MRHVLASAVAFCLTPVPSFADMADALARMDATPCENSGLACVTLTVPRDHRANDPAQTLDIDFAVSLASDISQGVLFYFVGGPGGSGTIAADGSLAAFDESLTQNFDIVFVDQRGTGPVRGLSCPTAQTAFDMSDVTLDDPATAVNVARSYVEDCLAEMNATDILPVVSTDQAIRDSELFRQAIGSPTVWLYGESYGTQMAQAYATLFPQAVRGVIIDGVVDLNLSAEGFYSTYTLAAERLLSRTFATCPALAGCAEDMQQDAAAVYDALALRARDGLAEVDLVLADGTTAKRHLTPGLLEANAFFALYSPEGRAEFLRALAAAGRDNLVPMLQLAYANLFIDPETELGLIEPGWSGAAYFAITCVDYDSGTGTPDERAARIIEEAKAFAPNAPRFARSYYLERLVCAFWPHQGDAKRPDPFAGGTYPTLVLNGDSDPITPISMAYSVLDNAANAYGVFMTGGPHVIWGRGNACPDRIAQDLLYYGTLPSAREQQCSVPFVADYVPLTLTSPDLLADPLAVAQAADTEILLLGSRGFWDRDATVTVGCDIGGTITANSTETGRTYALKDCSFWPGITLSGIGSEVATDSEQDGIILTLVVSGTHQGEIGYIYNTADEAWSLTGEYDGKFVGVTRTYP